VTRSLTAHAAEYNFRLAKATFASAVARRSPSRTSTTMRRPSGPKRPHFDLVDLRLFLDIAECNSLTGGAARSCLSLSAASSRIKALEHSLGSQLLLRGKSGVTLTPSGEVLQSHARLIVRQLDRLAGDLHEFAQGIRGNVRLFANTTATAEFLPSALGAFLAAHPSVTVDLQEKLSHEIVRAVLEGSADVGIVAGTVRTAGLQALPFHRDRLVLAVPRDHRLARAGSIDFLDTLDEQHVGLTAASAIHAFLKSVVLAAGRQLRLRIEVGSFDAMCRMIGARVGIGVLPESAARRHMRSEGIRTVALVNDWAVRDLKIIVRDLDALPTFARKLVDALAARPRAHRRRAAGVRRGQ
jgi:DNA-binding transcriptional LysR family regulator